jgi:YD repeat-containing protein
MKKLSDKEIKLFQFLDKNVGDEQNKKTAIKYLKDYLGFTPEEILKYYSLWYYSSGGDYETYEYDEEGELLNLISSISTLSSGQIDEIIDDLYDSGKLNKLLGDFFNSNCGGWRSSTPCITFESDGITIELDRENWRDYFSGLGEDDLWMYDNAFSSYSDYYDEVMEDEFDYAYSNDDTIKYLETIAILAGQNSWPGKNNEKFDEGEIKDFLNKTLPSSNVENIIDNYISEVSMELTRARLEAVRYCYNNESKYNTNETRCNSGNYCIFINYEDLKELIIDKNMLNLSELKDAEVNGEIYLNDCYFDAWIDKEGVDSIIRELNSSLERTIEKITEDDELDLEQHIKDRKEFFNMLDKFGFRQYISTTSGGYYKSEDGKIDLHTDKINFKDKKIKFTYEGKTYMVPFEDFPNWFGGSVLDLNESVKIKKKLLKEQKENITKISIFDFDGTLMDTPHPEEGKREWEEFTGKRSSNTINENIDPEEKYVNKLSNILKPPYFYNLKITETPTYLWNKILSKIFNQEVTYSDNSTLRFLTVTEPTEWYVDDEDENLIYAEEDSGFWTQMEYDESGKLIHQIDRDHNENRVVPNHPYG